MELCRTSSLPGCLEGVAADDTSVRDRALKSACLELHSEIGGRDSREGAGERPYKAVCLPIPCLGL